MRVVGHFVNELDMEELGFARATAARTDPPGSDPATAQSRRSSPAPQQMRQGQRPDSLGPAFSSDPTRPIELTWTDDYE